MSVMLKHYVDSLAIHKAISNLESKDELYYAIKLENKLNVIDIG